jgi:hypothetical protein
VKLDRAITSGLPTSDGWVLLDRAAASGRRSRTKWKSTMT